MSTVASFLTLVTTHGSSVVFHRDDSTTLCPCLTPEGARDPEWHVAHPLEPVCNEAGRLPNPSEITEVTVKAFVQPIQSTRATRLQTEFIDRMFGEIRADDHVGIFPVMWLGKRLEFQEWSQRGEDYILYPSTGPRSRKFMCVNANMIPDPADGEEHHWEVGLRLIAD